MGNWVFNAFTLILCLHLCCGKAVLESLQDGYEAGSYKYGYNPSGVQYPSAYDQLNFLNRPRNEYYYPPVHRPVVPQQLDPSTNEEKMLKEYYGQGDFYFNRMQQIPNYPPAHIQDPPQGWPNSQTNPNDYVYRHYRNPQYFQQMNSPYNQNNDYNLPRGLNYQSVNLHKSNGIEENHFQRLEQGSDYNSALSNENAPLNTFQGYNQEPVVPAIEYASPVVVEPAYDNPNMDSAGYASPVILESNHAESNVDAKAYAKPIILESTHAEPNVDSADYAKPVILESNTDKNYENKAYSSQSMIAYDKEKDKFEHFTKKQKDKTSKIKVKPSKSTSKKPKPSKKPIKTIEYSSTKKTEKESGYANPVILDTKTHKPPAKYELPLGGEAPRVSPSSESLTECVEHDLQNSDDPYHMSAKCSAKAPNSMEYIHSVNSGVEYEESKNYENLKASTTMKQPKPPKVVPEKDLPDKLPGKHEDKYYDSEPHPVNDHKLPQKQEKPLKPKPLPVKDQKLPSKYEDKPLKPLPIKDHKLPPKHEDKPLKPLPVKDHKLPPKHEDKPLKPLPIKDHKLPQKHKDKPHKPKPLPVKEQKLPDKHKDESEYKPENDFFSEKPESLEENIETEQDLEGASLIHFEPEDEIKSIGEIKNTSDQNEGHLFLENSTSRSFLSALDSSMWSLIFNPNAKVETFKKCITRNNENGNCRYIQHCSVPNIANSLEQLLNNACVIDDVFIGVCCPEFPVETVKVHWENQQIPDDRIEDELKQTFHDCGIRSDEAVEMNLWPWKAPLVSMSNGKLFCGGVIINEEHVLTAAHCTTKIPRNQILVRIGQHDESSGEDFAVTEIKRHAGYNPRTMNNDIALLKLARRIPVNQHVDVVCLPDEESDDDHADEEGILLGWHGIFGKKKDKIETLKIVSEAECKKKMGSAYTSTMMCTESRKQDERTCNADSGAPLIMEDDGKYEAIGILSWNRNDCDQRFPSTFSRISKYVKWIKKHAF